jgi:protein-disulfide isomerase
LTFESVFIRIVGMPPYNKSILERLAPLLIILVVGLSFSVGFLWQRITSLEKGIKIGNNPTATTMPDDGRLTSDQANKLAPVSDSDHVTGSRDAQVFLILYADMECPYCKTFHPIAKQAVESFGNQVAFVYRHFPLDTLHTKARTEAQGAECAASLAGNDAFWAYLDKVYAVTPSNNMLDMTLLPQIAGQVGVDKTKFNACLGSEATISAVEDDYQSGVAAGVTGTPANFVINKKGEVWSLPGAIPLTSLKEAIQKALSS